MKHCRLKFLHECVAKMNSVTNRILINSYKSFCWAVEILLRHVNGVTLESVFLKICFISYLETVQGEEMNLIFQHRGHYFFCTFLLDISVHLFLLFFWSTPRCKGLSTHMYTLIRSYILFFIFMTWVKKAGRHKKKTLKSSVFCFFCRFI